VSGDVAGRVGEAMTVGLLSLDGSIQQRQRELAPSRDVAAASAASAAEARRVLVERRGGGGLAEPRRRGNAGGGAQLAVG
jgi:hypothetical protein